MMKKILLFVLLLFVFNAIKAQENKPTTDKQNIKVNTNQEPFYPKGDAALYDFVNAHIIFTDAAKSAKLSGSVSLSFDVKSDSSVVNAFIVQGIEPTIDEQLKKIVEKVKFAPAIQNGFVMKMNVMMNFPIMAH